MDPVDGVDGVDLVDTRRALGYSTQSTRARFASRTCPTPDFS